MSGQNNSSTGGYLPDQPPNPPSHEAYYLGLQGMVVALTGLPGHLVRRRWQPVPPTQPPPEETWAAIGIVQIEADEFPYIKHLGGMTLAGAPAPGADQMQRHITFTVLATFYGPEADERAAHLRDALYLPLNYGPLFDLGIKLRTIHELAISPELINQQWIGRADLRIEFRTQLDRYYAVLNLDGADVNIRHDSGEQDQLVTVRPDTVINPL